MSDLHGANPLVLGVGFAAFRDLASFLRYGSTAPGGGSNPIAGYLTKAMTVGASQSAAFIHGFIFYGFNQDEGGRIVFDGAWPQIDGRMMVMNLRWGQPNNLMYLYMGGDEAPVWWGGLSEPGAKSSGRRHAASLQRQPGRVRKSSKLSARRSSIPKRCRSRCAASLAPPTSRCRRTSYRYYTPGATHGGGTVSFNWSVSEYRFHTDGPIAAE